MAKDTAATGRGRDRTDDTSTEDLLNEARAAIAALSNDVRPEVVQKAMLALMLAVAQLARDVHTLMGNQ